MNENEKRDFLRRLNPELYHKQDKFDIIFEAGILCLSIPTAVLGCCLLIGLFGYVSLCLYNFLLNSNTILLRKILYTILYFSFSPGYILILISLVGMSYNISIYIYSYITNKDEQL